MQTSTPFVTTKIVKALLASGALLANASALAYDETPASAAKTEQVLTQPAVSAEELEQAEKIKARLAEIESESIIAAKAANIAKNGYYLNHLVQKASL